MASDAPVEVELKLRSTEAGMASLFESELLKRHARAPFKLARLKSTYFDTPDLRLATLGLALRIRKDGKRLIQTMKGEAISDAVAKDRPEWEVEVPSLVPDLGAFGDEALLDRVGVILPEELAPLFSSIVERRRTLLDWVDQDGAPAVIEVAFDKGRIEGPGRRAAFSELELELTEGSGRALYELADGLSALAPLAIETVSKAGRGYRLVAGLTRGPRKVGALKLDAAMSVEAGMRQIFQTGLGHLLDNEEPARLGRDPEGVHQMRVALRRLRSALTIFQPVLGKDAAYWNGEFRWLIGRLGAARDLDVFANDMLAVIEPGHVGSDAILALRALVEEARADAYARVGAALSDPRYAKMTLDFALWIEMGKWRADDLALLQAPLADFAGQTLEKRYRRLLKRGRHFARLDDEARHELRKTLKKLRYGVDFFGALFPAEETRAFARKLAEFQDELGHLNDVAVAGSLARALVTGEGRVVGPEAMLGAGIVMGWHAAAAAGHRRRAVHNWRAFREMAPFWRGDDA